jgi:hypothetical protein
MFSLDGPEKATKIEILVEKGRSAGQVGTLEILRWAQDDGENLQQQRTTAAATAN